MLGEERSREGGMAWRKELQTQGWRHGGREGSVRGGEWGRRAIGVKALVGDSGWRNERVSNTHCQRENIGQREEGLVCRGPEGKRRRGRG